MTNPPRITLHRIIPATPHEVYRAWLEPDLLRRWLGPGELQVTRVEVDEREGGSFRIWQGTDEGEAGGFECEFLELVPDTRIVLRWGFVGPERTSGPVFDSVLSITLADALDGTTFLTLVHERLDTLRDAMPQVFEQVGAGWEMVLDKLTAALHSP
jgi:uncharacterized protein YndB with AHSA1/START domain